MYIVTLPYLKDAKMLLDKDGVSVFTLELEDGDTFFTRGIFGGGEWMVDSGIEWEFGSAHLDTWWKFVVMHNKKEDEFCVFWSAIQAG